MWKRNEKREHSSVGSERLPYKQRVGGSTPSAPTTESSYGNVAAFFVSAPFYPSHSKNHSIHILSVFLSFCASAKNLINLSIPTENKSIISFAQILHSVLDDMTVSFYQILYYACGFVQGVRTRYFYITVKINAL